MTAQFTVSAPREGDDVMTQRAVLATLPNDFRLVDGEADVVLLSPRVGDWAGELARIGAGTRAVVLISPAASSADQRAALADVASARGIPVLVVTAYSSWFGNAEAICDAAIAAEVAIVDLTAVVSGAMDLRDAMLELVRIAGLIAGPMEMSRILIRNRAALVLEVSGNGLPAPARLSVFRGFCNRLDLNRVARGRRESIRIDLDAPARPMIAACHDSTGSHIASPIYQSGYRAEWLSVHAALREQGVLSGGLGQLASDLDLMRV